MRITLDQVFEQPRSLECEYITRTERAEFHGEEVTATETMRVSEVIASTMSNTGVPESTTKGATALTREGPGVSSRI